MRYYATIGANVVQAAAHGAGTGFAWITPHTAFSSLGRITVVRVLFTSQLGSVLAAPTSPRIAIQRFSTTTNPTGGTVTPANADVSDGAAANWSVRIANGGMTITEAEVIHEFLPVASATAVGYVDAPTNVWDPRGMLTLRQSGGVCLGICVRQLDAGTAADTRRFTMTFELEVQPG